MNESFGSEVILFWNRKEKFFKRCNKGHNNYEIYCIEQYVKERR